MKTLIYILVLVLILALTGYWAAWKLSISGAMVSTKITLNEQVDEADFEASLSIGSPLWPKICLTGSATGCRSGVFVSATNIKQGAEIRISSYPGFSITQVYKMRTPHLAAEDFVFSQFDGNITNIKRSYGWR